MCLPTGLGNVSNEMTKHGINEDSRRRSRLLWYTLVIIKSTLEGFDDGIASGGISEETIGGHVGV